MKIKSILITVLILILFSNGYSGWYLNYSYNILKPTMPFNQLQITVGDFLQEQKILWNFYSGWYSYPYGVSFLPTYTLPLFNNKLTGILGTGVSGNIFSRSYHVQDTAINYTFINFGISCDIGLAKSVNNFKFSLNFRPSYNFNLDVATMDTLYEWLLKELKRDLLIFNAELGASYTYKRVVFGASYQFDYYQFYPRRNIIDYDHSMNTIRLSVGVLLGKIKN